MTKIECRIFFFERPREPPIDEPNFCVQFFRAAFKISGEVVALFYFIEICGNKTRNDFAAMFGE